MQRWFLCKKTILVNAILLMFLPTLSFADEFKDAANALEGAANTQDILNTGESAAARSAEKNVPGMTQFNQGGSNAKEQAIYHDLKGLEQHYMAEIDNYDKDQAADPIHGAIQSKQAAMEESDERPNLVQTMRLSGKEPVSHKAKFNIRENDPLLQIEERINDETYAAVDGIVKIPAVDKTAAKKENYQVTCIEDAEPVEKKQTLSLHIETKIRPAQDKVVTTSGTHQYNQAVLTVNLGDERYLGKLILEPDLQVKLTNFIIWYYPNFSMPGYYDLGYIDTQHNTRGFNWLEPPNYVNNFVFKILQRSYGHTKGCQKYDITWHAHLPEKVTFKSETWVPSDPTLIELEKQGICKLVGEECTEGSATHSVNGLAITRECWKKELVYECGGGSDANNCAALEQKGCWQIASRCSKQIAGFPLEYEQTFECPGSNGQVDTSLVVDPKTFSLQSGTNQNTGDQFTGDDFAEAIGKFSLVKEMQKDLIGDSSDPEGVRVFNGKDMSCDIEFGSGIKNCCRLKGLLMNVIGSHCPRHVTEVLAPAVVREKRCQLIEEKYCVARTLGICRKWRSTYCCFNSKLARVFQQIAHLQLGISWGSGETPNCGSLSPRDFERLNFDAPEAQNLLAEIINDAQGSIENNFQLAQQKLQARAQLTERVKEMQTKLSEHMQQKFPARPEGIAQ